MLTVKNEVGRLVEIRAASPLSVDDINRFRLKLRALIVAAPQNVVVCADATELHILSSGLSEELLALMRLDNYRIDRSAVLVSASSPCVELQLARLLSEAGNAGRRLFTDPKFVQVYLAEKLSKTECLQLGRFLQQASPYKATA